MQYKNIPIPERFMHVARECTADSNSAKVYLYLYGPIGKASIFRVKVYINRDVICFPTIIGSHEEYQILKLKSINKF